MKPGDRILFRQTCRGGYGFQRFVPGTFVRSTPRRVTVQLTALNGTYVQVSVHPKNVLKASQEPGR